MLNSIWRDLRYAGRSLAKARAFTFVCVVSLGIGMAPVIAIPYASRVMNVLINPPGVKSAGLVEVLTTPLGPRPAANNWSYPDFMDLRAADTGMAITGWTNGESKYTIDTPGGGKTQAVSTKFVSANYFRTFGVTLARGAGFDEAMDDPLRTEPAVIAGYDFWQQQLGADPDIVGKRLTLDGVPHVVVGVAPALAIDERQLFIPIEQHPLLRDRNTQTEQVRADRSNEWIHLHGRLAPGVSVAQASAAVAAVTSRLAKQYPKTNEFKAGIVAAYDPVGVLQRPQFRILQTVALTLTGAVLLVVSLNISGMMLVRNSMRERELSVRQAIGATRGRLIQDLLSEAVILAGLGGTLAALVLFNVPRALISRFGPTLPAQFHQAMRVDAYMIVVCVGLCLVTSLACGLLPAIRFSRPTIISSLKDDAGVGGLRAGRVHRLTAALQIAIAVPLIVMAGIALDRVRATATSDLGFDADVLYAAPLNLEGLTVEKAGFQIRRLRDMLAEAGGVASVTVADGLPLDFRYRMTRVFLQVDANSAPQPVSVHMTRVGDGYLDTMGIPLLRGRGFTVDDRVGAELVTIVSKPLADRLMPNGDVMGKRLTFGADVKTQQTLTVVGVIGDVPTSQMSTTREQLLLPLAQHPAGGLDPVAVGDDDEGNSAAQVMLIARRAAGEQTARVTTALVNVARELDPQFQPAGIVTGVWLRQNSVRDFLVQSSVAGVSGGVILMLSALGIYGVVGLMVAARTREIAVRIALGASRRRVLRLILFGVVKLVMPGIGVGLILTAALIRLNGANMGIPLSRAEPVAYLVGAAIAVLVAVLASLSAARRAASIQPMIAMRSE